MPFPAHRFHRLWACRLTPLVLAFLWLGRLFAETPSEVHVAPIDREPSQATTDELGEYIQQLERHLDWMHARAAWRKDSETLAAVEALRKKLAKAKERHRTLCRLCAQELQDTPTARACCQAIDEVLHEVIDDHLALMRRLRARRTGPPRTKRMKVAMDYAPPLRRGQFAISHGKLSTRPALPATVDIPVLFR